MSTENTATEKKSLKSSFKDALRSAYQSVSKFMAFDVKAVPQTDEEISAAQKAALEAAQKAFQDKIDAAYTLGATGPQGYIATAVQAYTTPEEKLALLKGCAAGYEQGRSFAIDAFAMFHPAYKTTTEESPMFIAGYKGSADTVRALVKIDTLDIGDKAALIIGCAKARKEKRSGNMDAFAAECKNANTMTLAQAGEQCGKEVLEALIQPQMSVSISHKIAQGCVKAVSERKYDQLQDFLTVYIQAAAQSVPVVSGAGNTAKLADAYRSNIIDTVYPLIAESAGPFSSVGLWSQKMDKAQKQIFANILLLAACEKGNAKIVEAALAHKAEGMIGNGLAVRLAEGNAAVLKALYDGGVDLVAAAGAQGLAKKPMAEFANTFEKENLKAQVELYRNQAREMTQKYVDLNRQVKKAEADKSAKPAPEAPAAQK